MWPVRIPSLGRRGLSEGGAAARLVSWTGALLFVLSLGYFVAAYVTSFGAATAQGPAAPAVVWNTAIFTAFAFHHSLFARTRLRRLVARLVSPDLERSFYVWVASLLFLVVCAWWQPVPGVAWTASGAGAWALRGVQAAALWLTLRSAAVLDVWELAGVKPVGPGPAPFKTRGPYGWVRHPIYTGWFLFVFAASPMTMTRLTFAVVSGVYLLIAIPLEERTMRESSGEAYGRYVAAVRWRLVPGVY
jgi:protein-S-isoprenylcysteine O-methyltransferase Ste14